MATFWTIVLFISCAVLGSYTGDKVHDWFCPLCSTRRTEVEQRIERLEKMAKDNSGKAPLTGGNSQQKRDDKATATGKPVDPNRAHVDKNGGK